MAKRTSSTESADAKKESRRNMLIAELSQVLGDDELMECIDAADATSDPLGTLKAKRDELVGCHDSDAPHDDVLADSGIEIIEKIVKVREGNRGGFREVATGFILKRTRGDITEYAGIKRGWTIYGQAVAFKTKAEAVEAARAYLLYLEDHAERFDYVHALATSTVDFAVGFKPIGSSMYVSCRLSPEIADKLRAVLTGLRMKNKEISVRTSEGKMEPKPVSTAADAIRYMLEHLTVTKSGSI